MSEKKILMVGAASKDLILEELSSGVSSREVKPLVSNALKKCEAEKSTISMAG